MRRVVLAMLALGLVVLLYRTEHLLILAFGAALGAVLLSAIADFIAATLRLPRAAGLVAALALVLGLLVLMGWLFGSETAGQAERLYRTLPHDWQKMESSIATNPLGAALLASARKAVASSGWITHIVSYGSGLAELVANFLIILVGAGFFASQPELYRDGLILIVPPPHRPLARKALDDVARTMRRWLAAQLVSMALMGVMIGIGLWASGLRTPIALGVLGGLSEFIPYVGPTLAMIPAIVIALAGGGSLWGTLGTFLVVRIVQANIITPLLTRRFVTVPPGLYLFLILAAGFAFGTFGLFFAGALAVVSYTLFLRLYVRETLGDSVELPGQ